MKILYDGAKVLPAGQLSSAFTAKAGGWSRVVPPSQYKLVFVLLVLLCSFVSECSSSLEGIYTFLKETKLLSIWGIDYRYAPSLSCELVWSKSKWLENVEGVLLGGCLLFYITCQEWVTLQSFAEDSWHNVSLICEGRIQGGNYQMLLCRQH